MKQPPVRLLGWPSVLFLFFTATTTASSDSAEGSLCVATPFSREAVVCLKTEEVGEYRRRYGLNLESDEGIWEVRQTLDRGLGVFATQDIVRGTHLMVETPLFTIDPGNFHAGKGYQIGALGDAVEEAFGDLNTTSREEFLACHEHRPSGARGSRELFIFISNAYTMPDGRVGIFPHIAKINHSCRPNSVNTFSESRGSRIIWAGRDISAGEEITVTYVPLTDTKERRRARLWQYGFQCGCEACRAATGDEERLEIQALVEELDGSVLQDEGDAMDMVSKAERLIHLVEQEDLVEYFTSAYRLATMASLRNGDMARAKIWSTRELEIHEIANDKAARALRREMAQLGMI